MYRKTVSVIIPYYRASQTIARAVESVLGQTFLPLEILIVDDGSPEDAAEATKLELLWGEGIYEDIQTAAPVHHPGSLVHCRDVASPGWA